jgi:hypothetical protein
VSDAESIGMRLLLLTLMIGTRLAQAVEPGARFTLVLDHAAEPGDTFTVLSTSAQTQFILTTPSGNRVTAQNATEHGFAWFQRRLQGKDWAQAQIIPFRRGGAKGSYTFEILDPPGVGARTSVSLDRIHDAWYFAPRIPEAIVKGMAIRAPGSVEIELKEGRSAGMFDVLVSDPQARVALKLPDGRLVVGASEGIGWKTISDPYKESPAMAGLLFPHRGLQYLIHLDRAGPGKYEVQATGGGEFRALFLPDEPR